METGFVVVPYPGPQKKNADGTPGAPSISTVLIQIGRSLDFRNADQFKALCQEQLRRGALHFIMDFSETGLLDSTGLGALFTLYRQVAPLRGQVIIAAPSRPVQVVMSLTHTYKIFRQFLTVEAAREALAAATRSGDLP